MTRDQEVGGADHLDDHHGGRGDVISINGGTGEVVVGEVAVVTPEPTGPFGIVLGWADEYRTLKVRTNADLPDDAAKARRVRRRRHRPLPHRAHVPRRPLCRSSST